MPSSKNYVRDYKQESKTAKARGETGVGPSSGDATRHRARRILVKKVGASAVKGKDVDHKKPLAKGGTNSTKNLRVRSIKTNRSNNGQSKGKK